jgi:hypothetical protein
VGTLKNLVGRVFGRWTVISRGKNSRTGQVRWCCKCSCSGMERLVTSCTLRAGTSKSCGCLIRETASARYGVKSPSWKGGRRLRTDGYVSIVVGPNKTRLEHCLVMEKLLGRPLLPSETVHHRNGSRSNNSPDNLELRSSDHGEGQTIPDLVAWATRILRLYSPNLLK